MNPSVRLGIARAIITPKVGCQLYGYSPDVISTSVHDDLTADVFLFDDGMTSAMLISVTVCSINTALCDRIRAMLSAETGVPAGHILIAATHTHSGPNLEGMAGWGDVDADYCDGIFIPALLDAARRAAGCPVPVTLGMAQGESLAGINRRQLNPDNTVALGQNPWGCFDPKMTVLSFADADGRVIANLIHYGCHGTASGTNTEITRDWPGVMCDELEKLTGGITAFFNGPEGDVGPRLMNGCTVGARTVHDALTHGAMAAQDAVRIYRQIRVRRPFALAADERSLEIPLEMRISREAAEAIWEKYRNCSINWEGGQRDYARRVLDSYEAGYRDADARRIPQALIGIGDVIFAGFPFELFSEIGLRIDAAAGSRSVLSLSNANGSESYLATQDALCRGGYEIIMHKMSYIQPYRDDADFAVVRGTLENLKTFGSSPS